jgi:NAD(P)-dependent dehydrogenase (short-subunit alcohol dehydrogenase family)
MPRETRHPSRAGHNSIKDGIMSKNKKIIALVTGASRGVGKGIAMGLGEAGYTVYVTGRTQEEGAGPMGLPGTVQDTAEEVNRFGGIGIAVPCDHTRDEQVNGLFERIKKEQGRLDILVNSVWGGYENMFDGRRFSWPDPFWEQPFWRWDAMFNAGVRAHYVASAHAAGIMVPQKSGLIVNISFWAAQKLTGNVAYSVSKAATDHMTAFMAQELRDHGVSVISLYPGLVRTESVLRAAEFMDLTGSESPLFIGRAVAGLASDPHVSAKSGTVQVAASLAQEYGFEDVDGNRPAPLTLEDI